jgi:4-alpha-glucanotransferase
MTQSLLDRVAAQYGLGTAYHDFRGELKAFSATTKAALLTAMGVDAGSRVALQQALAGSTSDSSIGLMPAVMVAQQGEACTIELALEAVQSTGSLAWKVQTEAGETFSGSVSTAALEVHASSTSSGRNTIRWQLDLLAQLPVGYHRLTLHTAAQAASEMRLIITPPRCYEPPALNGQSRLWGITLQLYTLRSANNWGIGDFGDLKEVIEWAAPLGCALVGLNPLHALMPADPAHNSPYSPSSRQFLNVLYVSLPAVPEYAGCEAILDFVKGNGARTLALLRNAANVDYAGVAELKLYWLRVLHERFRTQELARDTARAMAFRQFVIEGGEPLHQHAVFDALHAHLRKQSNDNWGWPTWPQPFRDPGSIEVKQFARQHAIDIEFYLYLQWLATEQLADAGRYAQQQGMSLGLYGDVAVGVSAGGSETWSNPRLYVIGAGIGAPPDPLALKGQDWGIPPQNPRELEAQGYQPFIDLLRFNMRSVGALRLDHVMALFRQWWVPRGLLATEGAYVHYPLDDLVGILCLESHRHQCLIIGEDLGTVPDAVRAAMQRHAVAHYKVLLFEKDPEGRFKAPHAYERRALAAVTTHDLPTFRGWWQGADIDLARRLDLYPDEATRAQVEAGRAQDRRNFMTALVAAGLWHWQPHEPVPDCSHALVRAAHLYLALSTAELAVVQIEDLAGMIDPVNVPGTHSEHPNWQRKVSQTAPEIFSREEIREMLGAMSIARTGRNPN